MKVKVKETKKGIKIVAECESIEALAKILGTLKENGTMMRKTLSYTIMTDV